LFFISDMLDREKVERQREQMTAAAFTAYLTYHETGLTWEKYKQSLGLAEKEKPISKDRKKQIIAESRRVAEKIMKMDRMRKKKNAKRNI
jgi:hypothetical protein